jgi:hypothetical protein
MPDEQPVISTARDGSLIPAHPDEIVLRKYLLPDAP